MAVDTEHRAQGSLVRAAAFLQLALRAPRLGRPVRRHKGNQPAVKPREGRGRRAKESRIISAPRMQEYIGRCSVMAMEQVPMVPRDVHLFVTQESVGCYLLCQGPS